MSEIKRGAIRKHLLVCTIVAFAIYAVVSFLPKDNRELVAGMAGFFAGIILLVTVGMYVIFTVMFLWASLKDAVDGRNPFKGLTKGPGLVRSLFVGDDGEVHTLGKWFLAALPLGAMAAILMPR